MSRRGLLKASAIAAPAILTHRHIIRPSMAQILQFSGAVPAQQSGFPTSVNTGVPSGTSLTNVGSHFTTSSNGQTLVAQNFQAGATIQHTGCRFTNCQFLPSGNAPGASILGTVATGPVFDHCTFVGSADAKAVVWGTGQALSCQIVHGADNCELTPGSFETTCNNVLIQDSYIVFTTADFEPGQHPDCVEADGFHSNNVLRHNTILNQENNNSCVTCSTFWGNVSNFTLDHNYMVGGNYTVYYGQFGTDPSTWTTGTFTNNHIGIGGFGYVTVGNTLGTITVSGNVDAFTGVNIDNQVRNGG